MSVCRALSFRAVTRQNQLEQSVEEWVHHFDVALAELEDPVRESKEVDLQVLLNALLEEYLLDDFVEDADENRGRCGADEEDH